MAGELTIGEYSDDDDLVEAVRADGEARLRVVRPGRVRVVLGRGSRPEVELLVDRCLEDGVAVDRRRGGGCAVVLDPGNLVVSVALPAPGIAGNRRWFASLTAAVCGALADCGIDGVRGAGISDIALGERKIGGACIHRGGGVLYYSATLLVEPDVGLMTRYLRHPPKEPDYRKGRSHADFVTAIGDRIDPSIHHDFAAHLEAALRARLAAV
jgi:lipoate-protein ligase A